MKTRLEPCRRDAELKTLRPVTLPAVLALVWVTGCNPDNRQVGSPIQQVPGSSKSAEPSKDVPAQFVDIVDTDGHAVRLNLAKIIYIIERKGPPPRLEVHVDGETTTFEVLIGDRPTNKLLQATTKGGP
jgi:hypothetical protein